MKSKVVPRSFLGKLVRAAKVYCSYAAKLAGVLRKLEGVKDCLEDDVRLSMRHPTDNNVVPCMLQRIGLG